jgi:hypothetical protein
MQNQETDVMLSKLWGQGLVISSTTPIKQSITPSAAILAFKSKVKSVGDFGQNCNCSKASLN